MSDRELGGLALVLIMSSIFVIPAIHRKIKDWQENREIEKASRGAKIIRRPKAK